MKLRIFSLIPACCLPLFGDTSYIATKALYEKAPPEFLSNLPDQKRIFNTLHALEQGPISNPFCFIPSLYNKHNLRLTQISTSYYTKYLRAAEQTYIHALLTYNKNILHLSTPHSIIHDIGLVWCAGPYGARTPSNHQLDYAARFSNYYHSQHSTTIRGKFPAELDTAIQNYQPLFPRIPRTP